MFGKNNPLPPTNHQGLHLDIQEIFPTIQGEGPYSGHPAVFIRLGGCNLKCIFCDNEFDSFRTISLEEILAKTLEFASKNGELLKKLVVITGGEPMRQPISLLCEKLLSYGFLVQIETNGTIFRELPEDVKIICSPKNTNGKYFPLRQDLLKKISALKFLISASNEDYFDVADVGQKLLNIPVYVQPIDEYDHEKNLQNTQRALSLAQENGYIISLQTHKILNIK